MRSSSAMTRTRALFADPSTAGAMTRTFRVPSTTPSTRSTTDRGVSRTANRTVSTVTFSEGAPEEAKHDEHDESGPVDRAAAWQQASHGRQDRLGQRDQKGRHRVASLGVDPRHQHPPEHQEPEREEHELDEGEKERHEALSLPAIP